MGKKEKTTAFSFRRGTWGGSVVMLTPLPNLTRNVQGT